MLVIDTATPATVVGVALGGRVIERRHDPQPGERPGHVTQVLALAEEALAEAGIALGDLDRIGIGVGPGSFTGLRIGIATARALGQASGVPLVPVSTLGALAQAAGDGEARARTPTGASRVLAVLDARRGEVFTAALGEDPQAVRPHELADLAGVLAVGDGAVRYRAELEAAGAEVPPDGDERHRVTAAGLAALAAAAAPVPRDELLPVYVRSPDAKPRSEQP